MENLKSVKGSNYRFAPVSKGESDSFLPSFSINEVDLPAINDWKPGKKYKLVMEVEMTGISQAPDHMKPKGNIGSFEVTAVAPYKESTQEMGQRLKKKANS